MPVSGFMIVRAAVQSLNQCPATAVFIVHMAMSNVHPFKPEGRVVGDRDRSDFAAKPLSFFWSWGLPTVFIVSTNFMSSIVPLWGVVSIISGAFFWMGLACLLNAKRCRRRHCYYSGPIFIFGAIAVLLVGFEIVAIGQGGLIEVVGATFGSALLTYLSEPLFGKYVNGSTAKN